MTRFDKQITKFCQADKTVVCELCPENEKPPHMEFDAKHGVYKCGRCNSIKAPNLVDKSTKQQIGFYWSNCIDCKKVNLTEKDQEPYWLVNVDGKIEKVFNESQVPITCTHCNTTFMKKYPDQEIKEEE